MTGSLGMKRAGVWLAAAVMLPATAAAQSNSAAPQTNPGINFNLPPSPRATPQSAPTSGPIVAPFNRPIPTQTPISVPLSVPKPTPSATNAPKPANTPVATPTRRAPTAAPTSQPAPTSTPTTSASPTPDASATVAPPVANETLEATATPAPVAPEPAPRGWSSGTIVAIGVAVLALLAAGWFLFGRRRRAAEEFVEPLPDPVAPTAPPEPSPTPSGHITIPARRRAAEEKAPRLEITLIPRRAGTNLTSAAVDYRVLVRNAGTVPARDIRMAMYMLSASARQAQDLQAVFAAPVDQPVVPPFELAPGGEIDLSGIAQLARERVNVMTIDGKPWFVPVLAMKAEYRWGENVGAPGVATAAHMIGIDRGEGAKMAPFRLDGNPRMHPEVAERKVA